MRLSEMTLQPRAAKINKVVESRFGFKIDYANLTFKKAYNVVQGLNETLDRARRTHGVHTAEQNPQYMELFMVRESLNRWMVENRHQLIVESEMAKAEATLAAKDMVDSIQDMLEKIGKMQNEQLPALLDTIRDQIGDQQAEAFKGSVGPLLQQLSQTLQQGREQADTAARQLTGEGGTDMGLGGGDMGGMGGAPAPEPGMGAPEGGDEFGATGAAAGGTEELGRERRGVAESRRRVMENASSNFADLLYSADESQQAGKTEMAIRFLDKADALQQQHDGFGKDSWDIHRTLNNIIDDLDSGEFDEWEIHTTLENMADDMSEGISEGKKAKPDFRDVDDDGNKQETWKKAAKDANRK